MEAVIETTQGTLSENQQMHWSSEVTVWKLLDLEDGKCSHSLCYSFGGLISSLSNFPSFNERTSEGEAVRSTEILFSRSLHIKQARTYC